MTPTIPIFVARPSNDLLTSVRVFALTSHHNIDITIIALSGISFSGESCSHSLNNLEISPINFIPIKNLGMHLDEKLNFNTHIKEKIAKANKGIGIIRKLAHVLPRESLVTIYKSFVRPHIDYGDIIYDQPNNDSFCDMIERVQYNAALAITGAIKGTSQLKLYKELGFESLKFRRWFRRLCFFI